MRIPDHPDTGSITSLDRRFNIGNDTSSAVNEPVIPERVDSLLHTSMNTLPKYGIKTIHNSLGTDSKNRKNINETHQGSALMHSHSNGYPPHNYESRDNYTPSLTDQNRRLNSARHEYQPNDSRPINLPRSGRYNPTYMDVTEGHNPSDIYRPHVERGYPRYNENPHFQDEPNILRNHEMCEPHVYMRDRSISDSSESDAYVGIDSQYIYCRNNYQTNEPSSTTSSSIPQPLSNRSSEPFLRERSNQSLEPAFAGHHNQSSQPIHERNQQVLPPYAEGTIQQNVPIHSTLPYSQSELSRYPELPYSQSTHPEHPYSQSAHPEPSYCQSERSRHPQLPYNQSEYPQPPYNQSDYESESEYYSSLERRQDILRLHTNPYHSMDNGMLNEAFVPETEI